MTVCCVTTPGDVSSCVALFWSSAKKGYGKTEFVAAIGLFFLAGPLAPQAPNIPVAAASWEQADLLFGSGG